MKVKECMCSDVVCVNQDTNIKEVAKLMSDHHIGCIPVCNETEGLVGLVTDRDIILRSIANDQDVNTTTVKDIMTTNVCSCEEDADINKVQQLMSELQVRRIPVVKDNKVIGILTLGDLAKNRNISSEDISQTFEHICCCSKHQKNAE